MITNAELMQRLDAAVKSLTTTTLGDSVLVAEQRDRFLQAIETSAPILREARRIVMRSHTTKIDRISIGQVLEAPAAEGEEFTGGTDPSTATNTLSATKARGKVPVSDEALKDSLAGEAFAEQLVDLIGARAGVDLEKLFVQGDTGSADPYLALLDGWITKAGNAVTGSGTAPDFDATDVEAMFEAQLSAMPDRFKRSRESLRFWTTWQVENDYRDVLRARGTELGDQAQTGSSPVAYKGIPVVETPSVPAGGSILAPTGNTVYGLWQDIEIEDERVASADRHDFHVRVRGDADYEDENGVVVADGYTG